MKITNPRTLAAIAAGFGLSWSFGQVGTFAALTFIVVVMDYITGLLAGRRSDGGLVSKKAIKGVEKKVGILCLLALGIFLDISIHTMVDMEFLNLPFNLPVAHVVTAWIIVTESISICENLQKLGVPIPKWMLKSLRKAEKNIDDEEDKPS